MDLNDGNLNEPMFMDANSDDVIYKNPGSKTRTINKKGAFWIPALPLKKWNGHTYVSGGTGSGKTYLINKMLERDNHKRDRIYFTDKAKPDSSLNWDLVKKYGHKGIDNGYIAGNIDDNWFIFDDTEEPDALAFRDKILLNGRYRNASVLCVNHQLRGGSATRKAINESTYMVMFPNSNRGHVNAFMKDWLEIPRGERKKYLDRANEEGRHLILYKDCPNAIATTETVNLL